MRDYKFRGMTLNGVWFTGNLAIVKEKLVSGIKPGVYISNAVGSPFAYEVRPETVGECTGVIDKEGNWIFEGDIIHILTDDMVNVNYKVLVEWGNDGFWKHFREFDMATVIGNKFENPELLK